jgi:hypothetical protein
MTGQELKRFARSSGADVIGIAPVARFADVQAEHSPLAIFPETRSVIVLGRRITRGTLRGVEEGTSFGHYNLYGRDWLEDRFLALTTFQVAEYLEDHGWEAVPLPNLPPETPAMGVRVRRELPPPNVMLDFDDAAVRAGVGEIGYCGTLLTPDFGPRQRIQVILTDAKLTPDPLLRKVICPRPPVCQGFCPLGAIRGMDATHGEPRPAGTRALQRGSAFPMEGRRPRRPPETADVLGAAGKRMTAARIDYALCRQCRNGALPNNKHPAGKPDRLAAVCMRTCVDFLEREGRVRNRFVAPFRKREAWHLPVTPA